MKNKRGKIKLKNMKYSKNWKPVNEAGEITFRDFNKRFSIDQSFMFNTFFKKYRIRFVQHPDVGKNSVKVFINSINKWTKKHSNDVYILTLDDCKKIYNIIL